LAKIEFEQDFENKHVGFWVNKILHVQDNLVEFLKLVTRGNASISIVANLMHYRLIRKKIGRYFYRNLFLGTSSDIMNEQDFQMVLRKICILERINGEG
jgi:hypothetical protein